MRIEFTAASLGAPARQFDLALTGVVAISASNQSYSRERFQLATFAELPFQAKSAEALSVANWRVTQKHPEILKEYEGTKLLTVFSNGGAHIFTRDKEVDDIGDLQGLKLRAAGGLPTDVATLVGGVPIGAPVTEGYQMLSRGIVDGQLSSSDTVYSFRLNEFINDMTELDKGLFSSTFFVVMNEAQWNGLSEADQQAIMSVSGEDFARRAGRVWDEQDAAGLEAFKAGGMTIRHASAKFEDDLRVRLHSVETSWVEEAAKRGVDGATILEETRRIVTEEQD